MTNLSSLHIAIIQTSMHWEDLARNLAGFDRLLSRLKSPVDLIVLPEMFSTGFTMNVENASEKPEGPAMQWMRKTAGALNAVVTGSILTRDGGKYYNRLVWMRPDGTHEFYDKRHLFRMMDEHRRFTAGNRRLSIGLKEWKICPMVCYDLRFPVWSRNRCLRVGDQGSPEMEYDVLIYVANWPAARRTAWKALLIARAHENQCYAVGVNRIGTDGNGIFFSGDSAVISPKGENLIRNMYHRENVVTLTLSYEELTEFRKKFPVWLDADEFKVL